MDYIRSIVLTNEESSNLVAANCDSEKVTADIADPLKPGESVACQGHMFFNIDSTGARKEITRGYQHSSDQGSEVEWNMSSQTTVRSDSANDRGEVVGPIGVNFFLP